MSHPHARPANGPQPQRYASPGPARPPPDHPRTFQPGQPFVPQRFQTPVPPQYSSVDVPSPPFIRRASMPESSASSSPPQSDSPSLSIALPGLNDLADMHQRASLSGDPTSRVRFAKILFRYIERTQASSSASSIRDQRIVRWVEEAIAWIKRYRSEMPPIPEALYLHADLAMAGTFPSLVPRQPQDAFRDFEAAANAEYAPAWYRIGREYEAFQELSRARDAFESGRRIGDVTCTYRLGMANLLGQLEITPSPKKAVDYLHTSALISERLQDSDTAAPMYIYGMMLAGEFDAPNVTAEILPLNPQEAGQWLLKAAYLNHAPSQLRCGHAYEYALLGLPFDPLLSVEYYYLASQQGDPEAEMALSKWFLCGAPKYFEIEENLAFTFAERAASKNLPSAVFALAYYNEVGIADRQDRDAARKGYEKVLIMDDEEAKERAKDRLQVLNSGDPSMSRDQHKNNIEAKLVRKHTVAQMRSDAANSSNPPKGAPAQNGARRGNTVRRIQQDTFGGSNRQGAPSTPGRGGTAPPPPAPPPVNSSQHNPSGSRMTFPTPNSLNAHPAPARAPSPYQQQGPPAPAFRVASPRPPPPPQQGADQRIMSQSHGGQAPAQRPPSGSAGRMPRYTLTDNPVAPDPSVVSTDSGYSSSSAGPNRPKHPNLSSSTPGPSHVDAEVPVKPTKPKGPETFAQMGIPVEKVGKSDDCIVM